MRRLCERFDEYFTCTPQPAADVIAAFNSATMFVQIYFNELNLRDIMRARGAIIEQNLERAGAIVDQLRIMRRITERPRIGFVSSSLGDGAETVFLAAHMEHLDYNRYDVRLYSLHKATGNAGEKCRAWAKSYIRLSQNLQRRSHGYDLTTWNSQSSVRM